jgi:hypothetical protein
MHPGSLSTPTHRTYPQDGNGKFDFIEFQYSEIAMFAVMDKVRC